MKKPEGAWGTGVWIGEIHGLAEKGNKDWKYIGFILRAANEKLSAIEKVLKAKVPSDKKVVEIEEIVEREEWLEDE